MLRSLRILFFGLAAPPALLAFILFLAVSGEPSTATHRPLSQSDILRAKQILNASPTDAEKTRTIELTENDLNIATNYLLSRLIESGAEVALDRDSLNFKLALTLPPN